MRKIFITAFAALFLTSSPGLAQNTTEAASAFLTTLHSEAIAGLTDPALSTEQKSENFKTLMAKYFDVDDTARFVMGRFWRKASPEERTAFTAIFQDVLVQRFLPLFEDYGETTFKIIKAVTRKDDIIITTTVITPGGETANIFWRLREKEDSFHIKDIAPEGISMRATYREDYTSALKNMKGNVSEFNAQLKEKF